MGKQKELSEKVQVTAYVPKNTYDKLGHISRSEDIPLTYLVENAINSDILHRETDPILKKIAQKQLKIDEISYKIDKICEDFEQNRSKIEEKLIKLERFLSIHGRTISKPILSNVVYEIEDLFFFLESEDKTLYDELKPLFIRFFKTKQVKNVLKQQRLIIYHDS